MFFWAKRTGVKLHCIQPGKPTQNAFVESFYGKLREYCLDLHWFASLDDARSIIKQWRSHYNHVRLHRSLGKLPSVVFAREVACYGQSPISDVARVKGYGHRINRHDVPNFFLLEEEASATIQSLHNRRAIEQLILNFCIAFLDRSQD